MAITPFGDSILQKYVKTFKKIQPITLIYAETSLEEIRLEYKQHLIQ